MNKALLATLSVLTVSCCAVLSLPAQAAVLSKTIYMDPAMSCQLSIPTVDTAVRPRATGYRNESASPAFVICGIPYQFSIASSDIARPTEYKIAAASFDGQAHTFNCTGVSRASDGGSTQYSTKSVTVTAGGAGKVTKWTDADLELGNFDGSITCVLPNGAAILSVQVKLDDNI